MSAVVLGWGSARTWKFLVFRAPAGVMAFDEYGDLDLVRARRRGVRAIASPPLVSAPCGEYMCARPDACGADRSD